MVSNVRLPPGSGAVLPEGCLWPGEGALLQCGDSSWGHSPPPPSPVWAAVSLPEGRLPLPAAHQQLRRRHPLHHNRQPPTPPLCPGRGSGKPDLRRLDGSPKVHCGGVGLIWDWARDCSETPSPKVTASHLWRMVKGVDWSETETELVSQPLFSTQIDRDLFIKAPYNDDWLEHFHTFLSLKKASSLHTQWSWCQCMFSPYEIMLSNLGMSDVFDRMTFHCKCRQYFNGTIYGHEGCKIPVSFPKVFG